MKVIKWLVGIVLVLAVVLVGGGMLISPKFSVTRSALVQAPPEKVYPLVASPKAWKTWSVWTQRDPQMQIDYRGAESGVGAVWEWKSKDQGDGRMSFVAAEPNRRVVYELFFPDFGTTSTGSIAFVPEASGTRVTWTMDGDFGSNPLFRWFAPFADKMVGADFEAGLANLKALAEQRG